MSEGFIKLNRKYFDNFLWNEPRIYSKAEAWLDLIGSARFEASTEFVNGRVIDIQRGEIPVSRRFLEKRWGWGCTKVTNFLEILTKQGMINQRQYQEQTILILCRYDYYNDIQTSDKPQSKPEAKDKSYQGVVNCSEKTNQRQWEKQTTLNNCNTVSYSKERTSDKPLNEPATNQQQTSDKPATNQSKEYKKERTKEEYNNPPLVPPEGKIRKEEISNSETTPIHPEEKKEKSSAKKERTVFAPPSVEMVTAYCKENGYTISAWKFVNYYTSNGWLVGKNKMKDWKAAVRTWQSKENENGNRQLPANNQTNSSGYPIYPKGNDAANKRAELDNLDKLAEAVLRNIGSTNG